ASGIFVVIANAWMNTPTGFELAQGHAVNVDPIAAMASPAALSQTIHMTLAAYAATGFAVAGIHAFLLLKDRANAFHRRALVIALLVGAPAAVLQPISGDLGARHLSGVGRAVDWMARLARCRSRPQHVAAARDRARRPHGIHCRGSRLDGDGARPAAVGDLRGPQDGRRRHADAGIDRTVPRV